MKKKLQRLVFCCFSTFCFVSPSFAELAKLQSDCVVLSHGAYVGGELGYDYSKITEENFLFKFPTSHGPSTLSGYAHSAATGFVGGGFVGYGQSLTNHLYLGVELFANGVTSSTDNQAVYDHFHDVGRYDVNGYSNTVSIKNNVGISVLPGIQIHQNALFYGRLGYSQAHIGGKENIIFYSEPLGLPESITPYKISSSPNGFHYGLGIEAALVKQLSLRAELIHTDYQSFITRLNNSIAVSTNQAMLSLLYHFS